MMKTSLMTAVYSAFVCATTYHLVKPPVSRPPNEFFYTESKSKDPAEVLNMRQILKMQPAWDPKIPDSKRTKKNAKWTSIKLTDGSVVTLKEEMDDVLNRMRNAQQ